MRHKLICKVRCSENYTSVLIFTLILRQLAQIASGTAFGLVDVFIASSLKANQRLCLSNIQIIKIYMVYPIF